MKFSIITCVYNNSSTLEDALESVFGQRGVEIEHIIIDGGSTDGSGEIIENWKLKIENDKENSKLKTQNPKLTIKFLSENDEGIYDALNKGIKMATGDVIGILHADDLYAADNILANVELVFNRSTALGVYGNLDYVGKENTSRIIRKWKSGIYEKYKLNFGWMPPHPTLFLRKEVFEKFGYYNTNFTIAADYEFILRTLRSSDVLIDYFNETITKMRTGGKSNKNLRNLLMKSREDFKALKLNNVPFAWFVLLSKNIRKVEQFF